VALVEGDQEGVSRLPAGRMALHGAFHQRDSRRIVPLQQHAPHDQVREWMIRRHPEQVAQQRLGLLLPAQLGGQLAPLPL
jgi:hypothetical protein